MGTRWGGSLQDRLAPASGARIVGGRGGEGRGRESGWGGREDREESRASWQCVSSEWFCFLGRSAHPAAPPVISIQNCT